MGGQASKHHLRPPDQSLNPLLAARAQLHMIKEESSTPPGQQQQQPPQPPSPAALWGLVVVCLALAERTAPLGALRLPLALLAWQCAAPGAWTGGGGGTPAKGRGTSRFRGVHWHKGIGKWATQLRVNGVQQQVGYFDSEEDAARAYDHHVILTRPPSAPTNFPRPPGGGGYNLAALGAKRRAPEPPSADADSTKGFQGVSFDRQRSLWRAWVKRRGQTKWLGLFRTVEEAAWAHDCALIDRGLTSPTGFNHPEEAARYAKRRRLEGPRPQSSGASGDVDMDGSAASSPPFGRQDWHDSPASGEGEGFNVPLTAEQRPLAAGTRGTADGAASSLPQPDSMNGAAPGMPVPAPRKRQRKPDMSKRAAEGGTPEPQPTAPSGLAGTGRGWRGRGRGRGRGRAQRDVSPLLVEGKRKARPPREFSPALGGGPYGAPSTRGRGRWGRQQQPAWKAGNLSSDSGDEGPRTRRKLDSEEASPEPDLAVTGAAALAKFGRAFKGLDAREAGGGSQEERGESYDSDSDWEHSPSRKGGRGRGRGRGRSRGGRGRGGRGTGGRWGRGRGAGASVSVDPPTASATSSGGRGGGGRGRGRGRWARREDMPALRGTRFDPAAGGWVAELRHHGKTTMLGVFATEQEAADEYDRAGLASHGPWFPANRPPRVLEPEPLSASSDESDSDDDLLPPPPSWGHRVKLATHPAGALLSPLEATATTSAAFPTPPGLPAYVAQRPPARQPERAPAHPAAAAVRNAPAGGRQPQASQPALRQQQQRPQQQQQRPQQQQQRPQQQQQRPPQLQPRLPGAGGPRPQAPDPRIQPHHLPARVPPAAGQPAAAGQPWQVRPGSAPRPGGVPVPASVAAAIARDRQEPAAAMTVVPPLGKLRLVESGGSLHLTCSDEATRAAIRAAVALPGVSSIAGPVPANPPAGHVLTLPERTKQALATALQRNNHTLTAAELLSIIGLPTAGQERPPSAGPPRSMPPGVAAAAAKRLTMPSRPPSLARPAAPGKPGEGPSALESARHAYSELLQQHTTALKAALARAQPPSTSQAQLQGRLASAGLMPSLMGGARPRMPVPGSAPGSASMYSARPTDAKGAPLAHTGNRPPPSLRTAVLPGAAAGQAPSWAPGTGQLPRASSAATQPPLTGALPSGPRPRFGTTGSAPMASAASSQPLSSDLESAKRTILAAMSQPLGSSAPPFASRAPLGSLQVPQPGVPPTSLTRVASNTVTGRPTIQTPRISPARVESGRPEHFQPLPPARQSPTARGMPPPASAPPPGTAAPPRDASQYMRAVLLMGREAADAAFAAAARQASGGPPPASRAPQLAPHQHRAPPQQQPQQQQAAPEQRAQPAEQQRQPEQPRDSVPRSSPAAVKSEAGS